MYRAGITGLMLTDCVGRNGGGLAHYVGQEKLAAVAPWSAIAFATDWLAPPRLQNAPSFHYVHSDQWRYEGSFTRYQPTFSDSPLGKGHTMDIQAKAVHLGWLPFYPQFNRNPIELVEEEKRVGLSLADLAEGERGTRCTFMDIQAQPARLLTSPCWSGIINGGRAYSPFCINTERLVPWRTLTGRQQFYHDHELYLAFGEYLPVYKTMTSPEVSGDLFESKNDGKSIRLNYLTPHGKWHIHSTYYDNEIMLTLSRGIEPFWINEEDARSIGVKDNDWVEVYNDHGVVVTRAVTSTRVPRGACIFYHSPERTISVSKSPLRGNQRAGGHNSLTRVRLKPVLMAGGYSQFTYGFNYCGPTGINRDTYILVRKIEGKPVW